VLSGAYHSATLASSFNGKLFEFKTLELILASSLNGKLFEFQTLELIFTPQSVTSSWTIGNETKC
jgi:hypothetical protein